MTDVRLTATNPADSSVVPVACNAKGELKLEEPIDNSFDGNLNGDLNTTGNINADGFIKSKSVIRSERFGGSVELAGALSGALTVGGSGADNKLLAGYDGSITAAGGKAGITAEGYLWCTTRRGDTVILDATSNGLATWADYSPPSRMEKE